MKKNAVLCLLRNNDSYVLLLRSKDPNKGKYQPVGGKIEAHEDPSSAALRETFEETGIRVDSFRFCGMLAETSPVDYNWTVFIYTADIDYVTLPECDEGRLEWIKSSDLEHIPTPLTDSYIYRYVDEGKIFFFNAIYDQELHLISMTEEIENVRLF